jgi:hypothetical protein
MTMREWLKQRIKKLFENTESTITNIFLLALFGGSATILAVSKKALSAFLQIATTPTPLWATISLVLLVCLYIYIKLRQSHSSYVSPSEYHPTDPQLEYITVGEYKWQVAIFNNGAFSVDQYPYCIKHDLKFIFKSDGKYCPEVDKGNCDSKISERNQFNTYETAKSYIEKEIRNRYGAVSLKNDPTEAVSVSSEPEPRRRLFGGPRIPSRKKSQPEDRVPR